MEQKNKIDLLEQLLRVKFPKSYREFLLNRGYAFINGLPILGLPISSDPTLSVLGATNLLRAVRPAYRFLIPIRLLDTRALCLDIENGTSEDAPLVEVNLKGRSNIKPVCVHNSFREYLKEGERTQKRINGALEQIRKCREDTERKIRKKFDHIKGRSHPRAEHWRAIRSCVHDEVVGLCVIKYGRIEDALLVAGFIVTDHPNYEEGHGIRNLALMVLSDAYHSGSSMKLIFGKAIFNRKGEYKYFQSKRIPREMIKLAGEYKILLKNADKGEILPEEALNLYSKLVGIPPEIKEVIDKLKGTGLTLQAFCYIVSSSIWTKEEATWILLNHPRPEAILLGKDLPENRLFYLESLSFGQAALALTRFRQKILVDLEENFPEQREKIYCLEETKGKFQLLKASHKFCLPWLINDSKVIVRPRCSVLILSRPYQEGKDKDKFKSYINLLKKEKNNGSIKALLSSEELKESNDLEEISKNFRKENIYLLLPPFSCKELNEEVDKRMSKARLIRK